jgi:4-hydroxy-3-polyprenylbenzoate decarboxylase
MMSRIGTNASGDLVVAMTGASGAPYALRLIEVLGGLGRTIHLSLSPSAAQVLREETDRAVDVEHFDPAVFGDLSPGRLVYHHYLDFTAGIASGSFSTAGMVIVPCSMSTIGSIASGVSPNLITRAADVHIKERRKLILVPRETPLS